MANDFFEIGLEEKEGWVKVFPVISKKDGIQRVWRWGKPKASRDLNKELFGYQTNEGEYRVVQKTRLTGKVIRSLQLDTEISSRKGTGEVESLFKSKLFSFPKPTEIIKRFVSISTKPSDIILDFFSGSCTTAHSIFKLNSEDNGARKYILVQLPEPRDIKSEAYKVGYKTIADIGKERIRRAGEKILQDNADKESIENLDIGFKVYKLDSSNIKPWDANFDNLEESLLDHIENIKEERSEDDVLYEILLKYGLDLTVPIEERSINGKTVYVIGLGALVVCLADDISLEVVEGIVKLKAELQPEVMRVVFKDNGFRDDVVKTNAIQNLKKYGIDDVKSLQGTHYVPDWLAGVVCNAYPTHIKLKFMR